MTLTDRGEKLVAYLLVAVVVLGVSVAAVVGQDWKQQRIEQEAGR